MAAYSRTRLRDREISPERTMVWTEPKPKRVPVVYYLSRNGFLEHPHFMEVPLSCLHGLYLKDVIGRLNVLRGNAMASSYSWSSKRSYKNGFVWQDLSKDDLIHPVHGHEYVLKGSELLLDPSSSTSRSTSSSSSSSRFEKPLEVSRSEERPKKKLPPSRSGSIDLNEYKIYRSSDLNADAATQTEVESKKKNPRRSHSRDICRDEIEIEAEISPPPSSSGSEMVEESSSTIGESGRSIATVGSSDDQDRTVGSYSSGRFKASAVLMQLMSCGSVSAREEEGMTRGQLDEEVEGLMVKSDVGGSGGLVNKEYFSGSLVEMKKGDDGAGMVPVLKRSNSYDAERSLKVELVEKEMEGVRSRCIPRRIKTSTVARIKGGSSPINSQSTLCNRRMNNEPTTN